MSIGFVVERAVVVVVVVATFTIEEAEPTFQ